VVDGTVNFLRASKQRMHRRPMVRTVRSGKLGISIQALGTTAIRPLRFGVITRYVHLSRINVRVDDVLTPHQPIGATGAHLHYEIRIVGRTINPLKFLHAAEVR
jgi:murein DD-endopeptidase MepM/ murein hydrolase activator NlpD